MVDRIRAVTTMTRVKRSTAKHFVWKGFSQKQLMAMTWWIPHEKNPWHKCNIMIADGSIRSGKTVSVIDSFMTWSLDNFTGEQFGIAGKSIGAIRKNILKPLFEILNAKGISYEYIKNENVIYIGGNTYLLYGAPNEASQDVLQGVTLAGGMIDEVALVPESFVDQFIGRCSVDGSKIFMTCNPRGPYHWFKTDYIDKRNKKNILYLHFTMDDNPSLSEDRKQFYKSMFSGVFYKRNVLGMWVLSEGLIFDVFDEDTGTTADEKIPTITRRWYTIDQGFGNATVFLHQGIGDDGRLYTLNEYYHSGRNKELWIDGEKKPGGQFQKSPMDYANDLKDFMGHCEKWLRIHGRQYKRGHKTDHERIFIDPASKGFINQCYQAGIRKIAKADNDVKAGIEFVATMITSDHYRIHSRCRMTIMGFSMYVWDEKAQERGEDKPVKKDDDAMDANRYGCYSSRRYFKHVFKDVA
jgi:PBSX family phage terminase large subunit